MKTSATRFIVSLLILTSFALGCYKKVDFDMEKLVGTYEGSFDGKTEVLTLKANGTYLLQRNAGRKDELVQSNSWALVPYGDETRIGLSAFPNPVDKGSQEKTSIALLGVQKKRDGLRLYLSYDRDWYYSKVK